MRFIGVKGKRILEFSNENGGSLIETALVLPVFLLIIFGAVDFGGAYFAAIKVAAAAEAGAVYGVHNPQDVAGMENASLAGGSGLSTLNSSASYGCECSDGSSAVASCSSTPSCTYNYVDYVDVSATATYVPVFTVPGLPLNFNITQESRMHVGTD